MEMEMERVETNLIVRISGDLDLHTVPALRKQIEARLDREVGIKNLILNLKGVDFVDSAGIGFIIGRYKRISKHGGQLRVVNIKESINKVFKLSGVLKIADIFSDEAEALQAV